MCGENKGHCGHACRPFRTGDGLGSHRDVTALCRRIAVHSLFVWPSFGSGPGRCERSASLFHFQPPCLLSSLGMPHPWPGLSIGFVSALLYVHRNHLGCYAVFPGFLQVLTSTYKLNLPSKALQLQVLILRLGPYKSR